MVRCEPNEQGFLGPGRPDELAQIVLSPQAHLGCSGITDMGVVLPNHHSRLTGFGAQVIGQCCEGVSHVLVTKVPRRHPSPVHLSVVTLGVTNQKSILLGEKVLIFCR